MYCDCMESYGEYKLRVRKLDLIVDKEYPNYPQPRANRSYTDMLNMPRGGAIRAHNKADSEQYTGCARYAYVVLSTTLDINEWPDKIIKQTGDVFYYGDNRDNKKKIDERLGNQILTEIFNCAHDDAKRKNMPPILLFQTKNKADIVGSKTGYSKFLGLLVPGSTDSALTDLVQEWRVNDEGDRFPNYRARFTVLNVSVISRKWLQERIENSDRSDSLAPREWLDYIHKGRSAISALISTSERKPLDRLKQLPIEGGSDDKMLKTITDHYKDNPYGFEMFAARLIRDIDGNIGKLEITSKSKDGGYDAFGQYAIGPKDHRLPIILNCFMEAKCYSRTNGVGVKEVARLLSRMHLGDIGFFVTTSFVNPQAYKEVLEDDRKIIFITGIDIIRVLREKGINETNLTKTLLSIDESDLR